MTIEIYNQKGEVIEKRDLSKEISGIEFNKDLVHQVYTSLLSNQRRPLAYTKNRAEVSGGGKKPWQQKGTGRARHGSIRSPIWKGGGVVFGPRTKNENLEKKINKKMKQAGLKMVLSQKIKDNEVKIIDKWEFKELKTKEAYQILKKIFNKDITKKILILLNNTEKECAKALKNIPTLEIIRVSDVNILHLLNNKFVCLSQETMANLEKQLCNQ